MVNFDFEASRGKDFNPDTNLATNSYNFGALRSRAKTPLTIVKLKKHVTEPGMKPREESAGLFLSLQFFCFFFKVCRLRCREIRRSPQSF